MIFKWESVHYLRLCLAGIIQDWVPHLLTLPALGEGLFIGVLRGCRMPHTNDLPSNPAHVIPDFSASQTPEN